MHFILKIILQIFQYYTIILPCYGQTGKQCNPGSECILLSSCSPLKDLLRNNSRESNEFVRKSICALEGGRSKVCCSIADNIRTTLAPELHSEIRDRVQSDLLSENCGLPRTDDRIIMGAPAPIGAYPWMAAMGYTKPGVNELRFLCAGSLISSRYILTAAHCIDPSELETKKLSVIHLGDWDLSTKEDCQNSLIGGSICSAPHIAVGVEKTISHPMYNQRGRFSDDVALIKINVTLDLNNLPGTIRPVCLPSKNFDLKSFVGDRLPVATGWGLTEHDKSSSILLRVNVPIADDELCKKRYKKKFVGNQLCVGGSLEGHDTCDGDSGGPLVISNPNGPPFIQIGIVSFGTYPCGLARHPGVYAAVADYRDWIIDNMKL